MRAYRGASEAVYQRRSEEDWQQIVEAALVAQLYAASQRQEMDADYKKRDGACVGSRPCG
jgi:hypothetical protein